MLDALSTIRRGSLRTSTLVQQLRDSQAGPGSAARAGDTNDPLALRYLRAIRGEMILGRVADDIVVVLNLFWPVNPASGCRDQLAGLAA